MVLPKSGRAMKALPYPQNQHGFEVRGSHVRGADLSDNSQRKSYWRTRSSAALAFCARWSLLRRSVLEGSRFSPF